MLFLKTFLPFLLIPFEKRFISYVNDFRLSVVSAGYIREYKSQKNHLRLVRCSFNNLLKSFSVIWLKKLFDSRFLRVHKIETTI